ncbi:uncharacterized protein J4E78_007385 [Alternaria triticimaculans]|uniref:uncharacterized protein n=1 Tax=Alternaria triticimaculans TaxID=297637 RepID=UPI0020C3EA98|nr:uncharacterized protein J4E78_007385 [Alternaria triticimaculans]KAI4654340.1 hypothetical protein J4E78_007385 [Alternaria triticimaculans]
MLTADAAKHGHESSPPRAASPTTNGSFLQMPLSLLGSVLRGQTPSPSQATLPSTHTDPTTDAPDTPTRASQRDAMKKPHDEATITLAPSRPVSSGSDATSVKPKKRTPRSKTSYIIARPVNTRSKLHSRQRVALQLHQVIASQRPKPAYEVVPFSAIPQRASRRLSRSFNTRDRLGPHDLLIAQAEAYNSQDDENKSEEDRWGSRDIIGVISSRKCDRGVTETTEICMNDGTSRWAVTDMPNGGYEFNSTDEHGLTLKARWVLKPNHSRRVSSMSTTAPLSPSLPQAPDEKKFTFSTLSVNSRRHPIIATMTRSRIDVMDTYAMPSAASPSTPSITSYTQSPTTDTSSIDMNTFMDTLTDKLPTETGDALRQFILASGVWVASREFATESPSLSSPPTLTPSATFRPCANRTFSMSMLDCPRSPSPASTLDEKRRSFPRMFKPSMERLPRRTTSFTDTPPSPASTKTAIHASPVPVVKTRARRANSTGTALHSMTGSMRKKYGLTFEDQTLVETPEERTMKRSVELLRIKELSLPSPIERPSAESTRPLPAAIPSPVVISPSTEGPSSPAPLLASPLLSPAMPETERSRKTQSAYAPITTTGMWDSGVTDGPGLKKRPTSMFVMNEKKRKQEKKGGRSKSKDNKTNATTEDGNEGLGLKRKSDWYMYKIKLRLKNCFKKEKA